MFNLTWRIAVISWASSWLWKQMCKAFAECWANLVILARREKKLIEVKNELEKQFNIEVLSIKCDVTSTKDIRRAAELAEKTFWKVDILVNCAWASKDKWVLEMKDNERDFTIQTDLSSVFKMTRAFWKIMKKNKYWRIINISSIYGLVWNVEMGTIAYHAAKGGVINLTRATAAELAKYNITCNAICPWYFETELTRRTLETTEFKTYMKEFVPMKRYWKEGELNAWAIFLASDEASYITWITLPIDGWYTSI